jgi:hypothetical protein
MFAFMAAGVTPVALQRFVHRATPTIVAVVGVMWREVYAAEFLYFSCSITQSVVGMSLRLPR